MESDLNCQNAPRRNDVRNAGGIHGLDYVEAGDHPRHLRACFLGAKPPGLAKHNLRITGGRRVRDIRIMDFEVEENRGTQADDMLKIIVDRPGDSSRYTLELVDLQNTDEAGEPQPLATMDKRYWRADFYFHDQGGDDIDCAAPDCASEPVDCVVPEINYLARDYTSLRTLIMDRLAVVIPDWRETHAADIQVMLAEVLAYTGDYLSYYQDAIATEAYLATARKRISVRRHARLVDYTIHEGCNARAFLCIEVAGDYVLYPADVFFITRCRRAGQDLSPLMSESELPHLTAGGGYEVFEPMCASAISLHQLHNRIEIYAWGQTECCLPKGTTRATLVGRLATASETAAKRANGGLHLSPGDILVFEERVSPITGLDADADVTHRQAVRLTRVTANCDPLYDDIDLVDVEWAHADALTFALTLSSVGPAPDCQLIKSVGVARGNVILVDHGRRLAGEDLGTVPAQSNPQLCDADCPSDQASLPLRFRPRLQSGPLTFCQPHEPELPASQQLNQDPRGALPRISVVSYPPAAQIDNPDAAPPSATPWYPQYDLLESGPADFNFAVEVDDQAIAHLRFGDGELSRLPQAGALFHAKWYRVGIGAVGNVGADSIIHMVLRSSAPTPWPELIAVRNPLAAAGGIDPEPVQSIKLFAPTNYKTELKRAVTAQDYQQLAMKHPGVQRAAARLRWTGSWYEARVAIDALGTDQPDADLLNDVRDSLHPYRRLGHDLKVVAATYVPIAVTVSVKVRSNYLKSHVKAAVLQALGSGIQADGTRGFFHPDNLTFGQSIHVSQIAAAAQKIEGVYHVTVTELRRMVDPPPIDELQAQSLLIGELEIAQVENDPDYPQRGRLRVRVGGGR